LNIPVFFYRKILNRKTMRIVIASHRINEVAGGNQASLRDITFPDDNLPGIGRSCIGIVPEVNHHTIHL
jgi:hypothetical protein